jgi:hypothetical protein
MSTFLTFPDPTVRRRFTATEVVTELRELRERRADEERERAEMRRANLAELTSDMKCAEHRISAWEKMHGLRMPSDSEHPVLAAIAAATQLTLADVQYEQRRRGTRNSAPQQVTVAR